MSPPVPSLSSASLKALRETFHLNHYADQAPTVGESGPTVLQMLFARGLPVETDKARQIFQQLNLDELIEAGLLYEDGNSIQACFQAQPYNNLIFLSDFFQWEKNEDFVLPIGPAGNYLALLTIRRRVGSTLDIGCGCGIQSLLAARHSDRVVATDINPRALALTRLNAGLNDLHNIETRQGSYFEPVQGECFDLIVANLPYVITPEKRLVYRTVDQVGDKGTHERLKETPAYLKEGGYAQILINWIHGRNQDPSEPIRKTVANRKIDTWLIHNGSKNPGEYAELWLRHQAEGDSQKAEKTRKAWARWYHHNHIEQIALGAITLRRRSSRHHWFVSSTVNRTLEETAGEQILRLFAARDYLEGIEDPNALLHKIFIPVHLAFAEEDPTVAFAGRGSRFEVKIRRETKTVLQNLDGTNTLEQALQPINQQPGLVARENQESVLADIRKLLELGMVMPSQSIQ